MRHQTFLNSVRDAYLDARKAKCASTTNKIIRCTSHSISSISEDLFAKYCADLLRTDKSLEILVDPQISFSVSGLRNKSGKRPLLFRPDVCFLKDDTVTKVFDIKTDLGYKRKEIINQAKQLNETIQKIKGINCTVNLQGRVENISISGRVEKYIIVVSGAENSGDIEATQKTIWETNNIRMFVLSLGDHLNTYKSHTKFESTKDFILLDKVILQ
jgi:hypothetical protein